MGRKIKWKLIAALAAIASLFLLAGCKFSRTVDEIRNDKDLDAQVTYYANGGVINSKMDEKSLYLQAGDKAFDLGMLQTESGSMSITYDNHTFEGWYFAELDDEGNVKKDENGMILLGEKVDFSVPLEENAHWKIAAKWRANVQVRVLLFCDEGQEIDSGDAKYKNGDEVLVLHYDTYGKVSEYTKEPFTATGKTHTFLEYCRLGEDGVTPEKLDWNSLQEGDEDEYIYARYLTGNWTVLKEAKDVTGKLFSYLALSPTKFYLANDIDCSGAQVNALTEFAAELQGNGYTISNLKVTKSAINKSASVFGNITETAVIKDVTFSNLTAEFKAQSVQGEKHMNMYFLYESNTSAHMENVVFDGGNMKITCNEYVKIDNLLEDDGVTYKTDNWLFGDENHAGFTVTTSSALWINERKITND